MRLQAFPQDVARLLETQVGVAIRAQRCPHPLQLDHPGQLGLFLGRQCLGGRQPVGLHGKTLALACARIQPLTCHLEDPLVPTAGLLGNLCQQGFVVQRLHRRKTHFRRTGLHGEVCERLRLLQAGEQGFAPLDWSGFAGEGQQGRIAVGKRGCRGEPVGQRHLRCLGWPCSGVARWVAVNVVTRLPCGASTLTPCRRVCGHVRGR